MNNFSSKQLEAITDLAEHYFATKLPPFPGGADDSVRNMYQRRYVEAIIQGLLDPDYWGC